jgi:hypothetical protein
MPLSPKMLATQNIFGRSTEFWEIFKKKTGLFGGPGVCSVLYLSNEFIQKFCFTSLAIITNSRRPPTKSAMDTFFDD